MNLAPSSSGEKSSAPHDKDHQILTRFVEVYCRKNHKAEGRNLCEDCRELLAYAKHKRDNCPIEPKPKCKDCKVHCYQKEHRDRIREVMRFSGMHFVKRGRVDWLVRYFL